MNIRLQLRAGKLSANHSEALRVQSSIIAGRAGLNQNHNEALRIRSSIKPGGTHLNHSETLNLRWPVKIIGLRQVVKTTANQSDRLELLVVRAGVRAGGRAFRGARARK